MTARKAVGVRSAFELIRGESLLNLTAASHGIELHPSLAALGLLPERLEKGWCAGALRRLPCQHVGNCSI